MLGIFKKIINKSKSRKEEVLKQTVEEVTVEEKTLEDIIDEVVVLVDTPEIIIEDEQINTPEIVKNNSDLVNKTKETVLKTVFGFDSFRDNQEKIIDEILNGKNILSIMPTGAGKSLCYQIPAILSNGITIVISPLISLMDDQILKLKNVGVECAFVNSTLSEGEYAKVKNEILSGQYQVIYIAPERLQNRDFLYISSKLNIKLVVVDEAHCVSQWGNDFRKSYLNIKDFVGNINPKPVLAAFTATATKTVQEDIISMLGLGDCTVVKSSFDRPNLYISKQYVTDKKKNDFIMNYLNENEEKYGIIYCSTRVNVEELYDFLVENNIRAGKYHAGMEDADRRTNQEDFIFDRINVIVATNAFGMGIDKSNVNFVIHYNCPKDIESYYQEIGRAGRDGTNAECILLYNGQDFNISRFLIDKTYEEEMNNINVDQEVAQSVYEYKLDKLEKMKMLCYSNECIKKYILAYFGEHKYKNCDNCSICENEFEEVDVTDKCNKILTAVNEFNLRYGETTLADILKGSKSKKITGLGLHNSTTYGILNVMTIAEIRNLFSHLMYEEYIYRTNSEYPTIGINESGLNQLNNQDNKIFIKKVKNDKHNEKKEKLIENSDLIFSLKEVRLELARQENVPAYIVFSDKTLENMCEILPTSMHEFLMVSGVGQFKADKYGEYFIAAIKKYIEKYDR